MLVLARKVGEKIVIGGNIQVVVVSVDGAKLRIGIIAPKDVVVDRQEIHELRQQWKPEDDASMICQPNS